MAKGDGGLQQLERGKWRVFVDAGKDPVTGKRRRVTRIVKGSKADARKVRDQIRGELEGGIKVEADKMTFRELCAIYTDSRRKAGKVKPSTVDKDEQRLNFICGIIGDVPLRKIDVLTIESLYGAIREKRVSQGYKCGNTTLHGYHVLIKAVLQKAVDCDLIMKNPCNRVDAPKIDKPERKSLTADEAARLLAVIDSAEEDAYRTLAEKERRQLERGNTQDRSYLRDITPLCCILALRLGLATGMRLGEVLRLRWELASLADCRLIVDESKTEAGKRAVSIDAETVQHLARWKRIQRELLSTLCIEQTEKTPVLCDSVGHRLDTFNFETWWRKFRTDNGFEGLKFHELRHTQATLLLAQGVDVKTVQARLGHSDASLTLNWYAHAVPENDQKAAQLIGDLFRQKPKKARIIPTPKSA